MVQVANFGVCVVLLTDENFFGIARYVAMASAARGGHIVICGLMGGDLTLALPVIPMRPLTLQGSYVGTLTELQELVALARRSGMAPIPVTRRPLAEANAAMEDLHHGRVVGRTVLIP